MSFFFALHQIADLAIEVEEAGVRFYTRLAEITKDGKTREMFLYLAKQEINHEVIFRDIGNSFKENDITTEYSVDIVQLLKSMIDDIYREVFTLEKESDDNLSFQKAIEFGIRAEEASIEVYTNIGKTLIERFQPIIEQIIAQEREHLKTLRALQNPLNELKQ